MNKKETITVKNEAGEEVKLDIRMPSGKDIQESNTFYASTWKKAVENGVILHEELDTFLKKNGIWDDKREKEKLDLIKKMADLQYKLKTVKSKSAGKKIAFEIKDIQAKLRELLERRNSFEANTAESMAQDSRFDFLLTKSVVNNLTGEPYFKDYDDYQSKKLDPNSWTIANAFAGIYYQGYDKDYEENLLENKFLRRFGYIDEFGNLLDEKGRKITVDGHLVNDQGEYVDENGSRVDINNNPLVEEQWDNLDD